MLCLSFLINGVIFQDTINEQHAEKYKSEVNPLLMMCTENASRTEGRF